MNALRLLLVYSSLLLCTACVEAPNSESTPALPVEEGPNVVLRGAWIPEPLQDGTFDLHVGVSGGPINGREGTLRIWVLDEDFDPAHPTKGLDENTGEVIGATSAISVRVRFPWTLRAGGFTYEEESPARTVYALVDCSNQKHDGLATVSPRVGGELFEYLEPLPTAGTPTHQPLVTGRMGFKRTQVPELVVPDLDGDDTKEVEFKNAPNVTHTFDEIWIWRYTPEPPLGWPMPGSGGRLHYEQLPAPTTEHVVETDFSDNATNGTAQRGDPVWLYAVVAVDDGSGVTKYWQYRTIAPVTADPDLTPSEQVWQRKRNATGMLPY